MATDADDVIDRLTVALRNHSKLALTGADPAVVIRAADAVAELAREYGETLIGEDGGWYNPFGNIYQIEDEEADEVVQDAEEICPLTISVRARYDYEVADELAVIAAAQSVRNQAEDDDRPVVHLGEAVYVLIHGNGLTIPALEIPQLAGLNGFTLIHTTTAPLASEDLGPDLGMERDLLPDDDDDLIYSFGDHRAY